MLIQSTSREQQAVMEGESVLVNKLQDLFLIRNTLQPRELIDQFEEIVYATYEEDIDQEIANGIFEWYESFPEEGDVQVLAEFECVRIHDYLCWLVRVLDEGYFSDEEEDG